MADTRKDRRAPMSLKVRFKSATLDEFVEHYSHDISRGGIFIKSKKPMAMGTLLKFELQLEDQSRVIRGVGRVVWSRDAEQVGNLPGVAAGMGIKFIKMDAESRGFVQRIVDQRDNAPGTFDQGADPAPKQEGFFPDLPAAELPPPEDRTTVRHASEFLATALADGDEDAAKEAEANAEAARKRTEEIQREREAAAKAKAAAEAAPAAQDLGDPDDDDEATVMAEGMVDIAAAADAAIAKQAEEEEATRMAPGLSAETAAAAEAEVAKPEPEPVTPAKSTPVVATPAKPEPAKPLKSEPKTPKAAAKPAAKLAPPPAAQSAEGSRSLALPIILGLAAIAVIGYVVYSRSQTPQQIEPVADTTSTPQVEPEPIPEPIPVPEPVPEVSDAAAPGVQTVSLEVESTPAGAQVRVAGELLGQTPVSVSLPADTASTMTLKLAGYAELSREVTPSEGATESFTLEALPFVLDVRTIPAGARVSAGGQAVSAPGELRYPRLSRSILVIATKRGYARNTVTVEPGTFEERDGAMRRSVEITLEESSGHSIRGSGGMMANMMTEPAMIEPVMTEPVMTEPAMTEPAMTEPAMTEPAMTEAPAMTEPVMTEPAMTEPVMTAPAMAPTMAPIPDNPF
ncbi:MAG: TIGR02266 family protein [Deltaproteobacteria bacterium]|nr:TIGR02266 family protein [Deltaproteobacteria bacterium]